jgi:hypothetical protein
VQVVLPPHPDRMTRWWSDRLPALFVARTRLDADLLAELPPPVDRAVVQGGALVHTGFRNDTLAARPLIQADDADAELMPGAHVPFVSGGQGHPLAWGVPAVDAIDRLRGTLVAVGGAAQRTVLVDQPDTVRWPLILDRLQRTADSARISKSRRHPRRGRVQVIPAQSGLLVVQSFYDWPPERAPALAGIVALQGTNTRVAGSVAAAYGALAHTVAAPDGQLRLRISRIYASLQQALRLNDWAAFGRALQELRRLSSER